MLKVGVCFSICAECARDSSVGAAAKTGKPVANAEPPSVMVRIKSLLGVDIILI
jgi:hypothetical protein